MRNSLSNLALAVLLSLSAVGTAACGGNTIEGVLRYHATAADGTALSADDLRAAATKVDVCVGALGFERRDVSPIPPKTLRIVIAERLVGRIPDIRSALADPDVAPGVKLTFVQQGE